MDTLQLLKETLIEYDDDIVEKAYDTLIYNNRVNADFQRLLILVREEIEKEYKNLQQADNEPMDTLQYTMRERMLSLYPKRNAKEVYRFIFPEDSLQICDELDSKNGIGNIIRMDIASVCDDTDGKKEHVGIQTIISDDLRFLSVLPKKVEHLNIVLSNTNLNTYFGNRRLTKNIDRIFGIIIEVDRITKESQMKHVLNQIYEEKVPRPNFLINSGHGLHFYYVFDVPIEFHSRSFSIHPVITNIMNAISKMIWTKEASDAKPEKMELNKGYALIGSRNRKNKNLVVTAYQISQEKCSLHYLRSFINKPEHDPDYDISFPTRSKITKEEAVKLYPYWAVQHFPEMFTLEERKRLMKELEEKKWNKKEREAPNNNLYDWFFRLIREPQNIFHGNRYKCMVALVIYAVKCGIGKKKVEEDLKSLLYYYNNLPGAENDPIEEMDIKRALYIYKNKNAKTFTFQWIKEFTEIEYEAKTKRREIPLSREEHLKIARQKRDEIYPEGSWRANSDGKIRRELLEYIRSHPEKTLVECIDAKICSRKSTYKYWEECRKELGLPIEKKVSIKEKIRRYREEKPEATKAMCVKELGISKPTVYKYWMQ